MFCVFVLYQRGTSSCREMSSLSVTLAGRVVSEWRRSEVRMVSPSRDLILSQEWTQTQRSPLWWTLCWTPHLLSSLCSSAPSLWMTKTKKHQALLEGLVQWPAPHADQTLPIISPRLLLPALLLLTPRTPPPVLLLLWRAHLLQSEQRKGPQHPLLVSWAVTPSTASPAPPKSVFGAEQGRQMQMHKLRSQRSRTAWLVDSTANWMSLEKQSSFP